MRDDNRFANVWFGGLRRNDDQIGACNGFEEIDFAGPCQIDQDMIEVVACCEIAQLGGYVLRWKCFDGQARYRDLAGPSMDGAVLIEIENDDALAAECEGCG